jgi:glucose/arabinose dehydrogenase
MIGKRRKRWILASGVAALVAILSFVVYRTRTGGAGAFGSIERLVLDQSSSGDVDWKVVAHGFSQVTDIQFVPGESHRAIVLGKEGAARLITLSEKRAVSAASSKLVFEVEVSTASELGLLGLAFHPDYLENGLFYVNDTPLEGPQRTRITEWELPALRLGHQPAKARRVLLEVEQPFANHNAGQLVFGPDGMLYVGLGDGGKRADPHGHGQNLSTLLGSMLRIDVNRRDPGKDYAIPPDNPFVGRAGARGEIWAYGLRNPWRYSFDPRGRLIVADVGQDEFEEVDIVAPGDNLGWVVREASHCFPPEAACQSAGFVEPVFEYPRHLGRSITGGYVYLGRELPSLSGRYLCADYSTGNLWALQLPSDRASKATSRLLGTWSRSITTFGRAANGEIFAGDFSSGEVVKLISRKPSR